MVDLIKAPDSLLASYRVDVAPSVLAKPYNLRAAYDENAGGDTQPVNVVGFSSSVVGNINVSYTQHIIANGFDSSLYGNPKGYNTRQQVQPGGVFNNAFGITVLKNKNQSVSSASFDSSQYGNPTIYNLRQHLNCRGFQSDIFGTAYVQGGIKFVYTHGLNALDFPIPNAVNTRANQCASPSGIGPISPPAPNVSPRIVYTPGILGNTFGMAWVQRNPSPKGFSSDSYGMPWVSHSPRYITPNLVIGFESGYPKAFDPTQKIHHEGSPQIPSGIFGDIAIKNSRRLVSIRGEDQSRYGDWTEIHSNLINISVHSFDSNVFGTAAIWNKTPSVIPRSWDAATFGTTFISDRVRRIIGRGIEMAESQRFGKHIISKPPEIKLGAINTLSFGNTWVSNKRRNLTPSGFNSLQFNGAPIVWFRYRYVIATGVNFSIVAAPKIEHSLRNLVTNGSSFNVFGIPIVWFRVRSIEVPSIFREFETKHLVGGTQHIRPSGFDAVRFGERIIPEIQGIYAQGFNTQGFSELNQIELHRRWVRASGFLSFGQQTSDRYGTAKIWNKRQYIRHSYDSGDGLNPGKFGQWSAIANRNREMKVSGFDVARFGYHQIDNNARPLLPPPFTPSVFGTAMVADRIRRVRLEGMEAPYMSGWGRLFNSAHQINVSGGKHHLYGHPTVINTRREYRWIGAFESMQFGQPMIAFRIRKIDIESRYGINPIYMPLPKVELRTRYIEPIGIERDAYGGPSLHIKWNIITTRWTHRDMFGNPNIWNVTPELKQRGANSEEFGKPAARLQWDKYSVEGFGNEIFGRQLIAFRDRSMKASGFNAFVFGRVNVTKTGAPPYSLQMITLDWAGEGERPDDFSGNGIEVPRNQVPEASLKTNMIFASGFVATQIGSHHAQSNGILVEPGIQQSAIGDHIVGLKNRSLSIPSIASKAAVSQPRLSPHTIYAVTEAPEQAQLNHPTGYLHAVNSNVGTRNPGEVFGWATVTLLHRALTLGAGNQSILGRPSLVLKKHYIKPIGIQSFRMGWHFLSDGSPRDLQQFDSLDQALYGRPSVVSPYYGPRYIRPDGVNAAAFDRGWVEYFHRTVRTNGFNALAMGTEQWGDTPYKPQGLWIGPQMPTIPNGFESQLFGIIWISNKIRDITAVGFDSMSNDWDIANFGERLKVVLVKKPIIIESQNIKPLSFGHTTYGVPDIRLKAHYIRPDGNSNQFRKGGPQ